MKRIILSSFLMVALCLNAQVIVDNFENTSNSWVAVSCSSEIVSNPYQMGLNLSCTCLKITRTTECENWSGTLLNNYKQTGYKYVHAFMYRSNTNVPNLKIFDSEPSVDITPMNAIVANQWQDVVFDISEYASRGTDFIFFMVDRTNISQDAWMLVDEVQLSNDATPRTLPNEACGGGQSTYTLVWNEDFTESSLDNAVWNVEVNGNGGGNNELQYYCEKGVSLGVEPQTGKHCLILTAVKESYKGKECTSGRVNTKGKMYYTFGKIEARIKFPKTANGLWPAFWQMGNNFDKVGWPQCGETDIIELGHQNAFKKGTQERYFNGAMHVGEKWDAVWSEANSVTWPYSVEDTFHIVTMIWTPNSVDMYMDKETHPENDAYFHQDLEPNENPYYDRSVIFGKPNFIIANLAVGGNFPGIYNINGITALADGSRAMYIDWIRIYQCGDVNQSFVCPSPSDPIEPDNQTGLGSMDFQNDNVRSSKILHNGTIYILRNGNIYTISGQLVK